MNYNRDEFEEATFKYFELLYNKAWDLINNFTLVKYMVENTYRNAFQEFKEHGLRKDVKLWLFQLMIQLYQSKSPKAIDHNEDNGPKKESVIKIVAENHESHDDRNNYSDEANQVLDDDSFPSYKTLSDEIKIVWMLTIDTDFTYKETAKILGISEAKVILSLDRGRALMKTFISTV